VTPGIALGGFFSTIVCSSNLPDKIAIAVDNQVDDGDARAGNARAQLQTAGPNPGRFKGETEGCFRLWVYYPGVTDTAHLSRF